MSRPVVAVVGRPNVGKSTLFNRVVGFAKAVVHDRAGVTRDRLYERTRIGERPILLVDTGGIEPDADTDLLASMRRQSLVAVEEADVIVFVASAPDGVTPADEEVAELLRRSGKPVVLVVNKVDGPGQEDLSAEFWSLGFGTLVTLSATHGRGFYDLEDAVVAALPAIDPAAPPDPDDRDDAGLEGVEEGGPIRIAVVGRPNIGKSTLVNALLGEDRHVVDDRPGTTMDPIDSALRVEDRDYVLVDTAGVRKKARIDDLLERWVSLRSIRAIERCHVVLLLVDGTEGVTEQDARLGQLVLDRGRAVVIVVNKWDLARGNPDLHAKGLQEQLERHLPHLSFAPHLFVSAKTGKGLHRVLPTVDRVYQEFDKRIPTPQLNRFLRSALHAHTPPQQHHRPVRIHYMSQTRVRPPTFAFFANSPEGIEPAYQRYLANRLRDEFDFRGTPLRLHFRAKRKSDPDAPKDDDRVAAGHDDSGGGSGGDEE